MDDTVFCMEVVEDGIDDGLFMHDPAEDDVVIGRTGEEVIENITDVIDDHRLCFFIYLKGMPVPAPVTIEEDTVIERVFQLLGDGCFANTHRSSDQIECFHHFTGSPQNVRVKSVSSWLVMIFMAKSDAFA